MLENTLVQILFISFCFLFIFIWKPKYAQFTLFIRCKIYLCIIKLLHLGFWRKKKHVLSFNWDMDRSVAKALLIYVHMWLLFFGGGGLVLLFGVNPHYGGAFALLMKTFNWLYCNMYLLCNSLRICYCQPPYIMYFKFIISIKIILYYIATLKMFCHTPFKALAPLFREVMRVE